MVVVLLNGEITEPLADEVVKHYETVKTVPYGLVAPHGVCRKVMVATLVQAVKFKLVKLVGTIAA